MTRALALSGLALAVVAVILLVPAALSVLRVGGVASKPLQEYVLRKSTALGKQLQATGDELRARAAVRGIRPTPNDLRIAAHARQVKVFVYDLATPGFQPAMNLTRPDSAACNRCPPVVPGNNVDWEGFPTDPCNGFFGRMQRRKFAAPYQGNYFANHAYGQQSAGAAHSRLLHSTRRFVHSVASQACPQERPCEPTQRLQCHVKSERRCADVEQ